MEGTQSVSGDPEGMAGGVVAATRRSTSSSSRRIRLLLLLTSTAGGAGQQNYFLAQRLSRARFDLTVAFGPGYPLDREFAKLDVPVRHVSMSRRISPLVNLRGFFQIWRLIRRGDYDIVCTSCSIAGLIGRVTAALEGVPNRVHVLHVYASRPYQNELKRQVFRVIERLLDLVTTRYVAVSQAAMRHGVDNGILRPEKVDVIFNGVERPEVGGRSSGAMRRELSLREGTRVVGTLGRYETQKGLRYLLEAVPLVLRRRPNTEFLLVGDGPLREELESLARDLGIERAVHFTGWRDDVPDVLRVMDVFCLASLWETFGLVLAEAMLASLPVVATRVDAIPEVTADGETGILVAPRDPHALASGVLRLLEDPDLARRMGAAGFRRASEMFSLETMVREYERCFEGLAGRRTREAASG